MNNSIDFKTNIDTEIVNSKKISCSGVGGSLGHPKIFLDMGDLNEIRCPYCSKLFIFEKSWLIVPDKNHLILIDGSGYIFRAYYALPPLYRKSDGLPTGAVNGFCNMLFKLIEDTKSNTKASHLAVIFDSARKTFRNDIYDGYKANRGEPPEDLIPQFKIIKESVKAFGIPSIELSGFEADDIIATYAKQAAKKKWKVSIVSSDKDLMQVVTDDINLVDTMKNKYIGVKDVIEKFGVKPNRVIDVQALAGDSSDNVPGAPGIGLSLIHISEPTRPY